MKRYAGPCRSYKEFLNKGAVIRLPFEGGKNHWVMYGKGISGGPKLETWRTVGRIWHMGEMSRCIWERCPGGRCHWLGLWDRSGEEWVSLRCIFEGNTELSNKSGMEIEGKDRLKMIHGILALAKFPFNIVYIVCHRNFLFTYTSCASFPLETFTYLSWLFYCPCLII